MGHPLSQTIFTSLYVDRLLWPEPAKLSQATFVRGRELELSSNPISFLVLRASCLALIKACDFVYQTINKETYYEVGMMLHLRLRSAC